MAYYMPTLARLALADPTSNYGWYGDTLHIHLSCNGNENAFFRYCNHDQRKAIASLLRYLNIAYCEYEMRLTEPEEFEQCATVWDSI